jgi:hypothetical protein
MCMNKFTDATRTSIAKNVNINILVCERVGSAQSTWCGYDVPGTNLLHDLKGAMPLDRSEDTSVHVSTCTSYYFNALTPFVWKLWR